MTKIEHIRLERASNFDQAAAAAFDNKEAYIQRMHVTGLPEVSSFSDEDFSHQGSFTKTTRNPLFGVADLPGSLEIDEDQDLNVSDESSIQG